MIRKIIIISTILVSIPIIFYVGNFWDNTISKNVTDWAIFGDYFGGTVSTVISFVSFIVLTYLTYLVSEQSNKENKNLSLLMKKFDAYGKLAYYLPSLHKNLILVNKFPELFSKNISSSNVDLIALNEDKIEFYSSVKTFSEFYYFLFSFNAQFGRLFSYDFKKEEFTQLIANANSIKLYFESISDAFRYNEAERLIDDPGIIMIFFDDFAAILNQLKNELE